MIYQIILDSQIFLVWFSPFQSQIPLFVILGNLNVCLAFRETDIILFHIGPNKVFVGFHNLHFGSHAFLGKSPIDTLLYFQIALTP